MRRTRRIQIGTRRLGCAALLVCGLVLMGLVLPSLDYVPGVTPLNRLTRPWAILSGWETQACAPASVASCQPYALYVPQTYRSSRPAPLLVLLHGYRQSPYSFVRSDIVRLAQEGGYVLIAPRGGGNVWFQGEGEDDTLNAIADVRARLAIDPARIYLVGFSMGGYGALSLGIRHPDQFAALVAIASPQREPWAEWVTTCPGGPAYVVHGASDRRVSASDSQALYDHLNALGCDVDLTLVPDAGHTFDTLDQVLLELATLFERQGG